MGGGEGVVVGVMGVCGSRCGCGSGYGLRILDGMEFG
jgi:hypothetical protein